MELAVRLMRLELRRAAQRDTPRIWALNNIPHIGATADSTVPLDLPIPVEPAAFSDLVDVETSFIACGGDFVVAEEGGMVLGMGGFRPNNAKQVEMLRVRVHPAARRRGIGRAVMLELERRATERGYIEAHLDTATNQPEAIRFYEALGYREVGRETDPQWSWTLVYFTKRLRRSGFQDDDDRAAL